MTDTIKEEKSIIKKTLTASKPAVVKAVKKPVVVKDEKKIVKKITKDTKTNIEKSELAEMKIKISDRYFETMGRRKTASARMRLFTKGDKKFIVNGKEYKNYFPTLDLQKIVLSSLDKMNLLDKFTIEAKVKGGGIFAQAEAIRHGIARALVEINPNFRKRLKKVGYLTRDSRMRERKKFGLKRARKSPQWAKR